MSHLKTNHESTKTENTKGDGFFFFVFSAFVLS